MGLCVDLHTKQIIPTFFALPDDLLVVFFVFSSVFLGAWRRVSVFLFAPSTFSFVSFDPDIMFPESGKEVGKGLLAPLTATSGLLPARSGCIEDEELTVGCPGIVSSSRDCMGDWSRYD